MSQMTKSMTVSWYERYGWVLMNKWLTEMAAKNYRKVYIANFEFIPGNIDKEAFVQTFNLDSNNWRLTLDDEGDFVCSLITRY